MPIKPLKSSDFDLNNLDSELLNSCGFGIIILDEFSRLLYWNNWISKHTNLSLQDNASEHLEIVLPILQKTRLLNAIDDALHYRLPSSLSHKLNPQTLPLFKSCGTPLEHSIKVIPLKKPNDTFHCLIEVADISASIKREKQLRDVSKKMRHEKEWANVTLMSIADAVITTDPEGCVIAANKQAEKLTGLTKEMMQAEPITRVCPITQDVEDLEPHPVIDCLKKSQSLTDTDSFHFISSQGTSYAVNLSVAPIIDEDNALLGSVMTFRDITHSRNIAEQLDWQAKHDHLTGLINRRELEVQLDYHRENAKSGHTHFLMYIDLDQFKIINDTCGHGVGDTLLQQISVVLQEQLRQNDILARLGGDEFCIILPNCPSKNAQSIANTLRQSILEHRFVHNHQPYVLGASIGLTEITGTEKNSAEILSAADSACYVAKSTGRNRVHLHNSLDSNVPQPQEAMQWFSRLQSAIEDDRFVLYAQEIVSINRKKDKHYEVLIRMLDHDGSIIPPNSFIPAAERFSLMQRIDRWVLEHVCMYLADLQNSDKKLPIISVNLSGTSIGDTEFLQATLDLFKQYNTPAEHICFEITETAAISNLKEALAFMNEMKKRGCMLSLDDFGSGLSSFAYLKDMPVDYLKIDGHFVKNITHDDIDKAFVASIHQIAQVMNIKTIAEFVENDEILSVLKTLGIDYAQGYGIAKPVPLDTIEV